MDENAAEKLCYVFIEPLFINYIAYKVLISGHKFGPLETVRFQLSLNRLRHKV